MCDIRFAYFLSHIYRESTRNVVEVPVAETEWHSGTAKPAAVVLGCPAATNQNDPTGTVCKRVLPNTRTVRVAEMPRSLVLEGIR